MFLWLGLISWLLIGAAAGLLARRFLGGARPLGWTAPLFVGVGGALVGGLLATALGFGGLAGFDVRALLTAALTATLSLLLLRLRPVT